MNIPAHVRLVLLLLVGLLGIVQQSSAASGDPCAALTPEAIQEAIMLIDQSKTRAQADVAINGSSGAYASAPRDTVHNLVNASTTMTTLQTWLHDNHLNTPFVSNTTAAYNVHGAARDAVPALHHARHWATISIAWHVADTDARASFDLTSQAIQRVEALGEQAGRCYIQPY